MKKILLSAAVAVLTMASCSKDRTCTCTNTPVSQTVNGVSQTVGSSSSSVTKLTKVSKKGADCNSGETTVTSTQTYGGVVYTVVQVEKADCTLN